MNSTDPATGATEEPSPAKGRQPSESGGPFKTVTANAVVTISLIGATAYVVTRLSHVTFYNRFGVDPSEVGLTYTETLARAAAGLVVLTLGALVVGLSYWHLWKRWAKWRMGAAFSSRYRDWSGVIMGVYLLLGGLFFYLPFMYRMQASEVLRGNTLRPGFWTRSVTNPLGLRAERVRVKWIDDVNAAYDFGTRTIMYLGRAGGIAILYDPKWHRTVRVSDSAIVITRRNYIEVDSS